MPGLSPTPCMRALRALTPDLNGRRFRTPVKPEILVIAPIPPELRERLTQSYTLVEGRPDAGDSRPGPEVAVTTSMAGIDRSVMEALPDLRLVACNGTGLDLIDTEAARERGITIRHTPDAVTDDTADSAIGLIYATLRRIAEADRFVRSGGWRKGRMTPARRVFSRHIGIVGLGKIGGTIARRAAALGMEVSYTGPNRKDAPYSYVHDIAELARRVDILVLSCPASAATRGIVDGRVLQALGPEGYLINVSRGNVVQEDALICALDAGTIRAAGLDVFENEPDIDPRFFALENVVLQPHYAAVTVETRHAMADVLESAIHQYFANRR